MICRFALRFRIGCADPQLADGLDERVCALDLGRTRVELLVAAGDRVVTAPSAPGLLIGRAFRKSGAAVTDLQVGEQHALGASLGSWAIDRLWGSYCLVLATRAGGIVAVRDPSGGLPIYHANCDGFDHLFSDLGLAMRMGLRIAGLDLGAVAQMLRFPMLRARRTGLSGISEILPGERIGFSDKGTGSDQLWSPWKFCAHPVAADPVVLRETVGRCVDAWSRQFGSIQLELSGGLDSSIVAASLQGRAEAWRAATVATPAADGDERLYARAVAEYVGVDLHEIPLDPAAALSGGAAIPLRPRPGGFGLLGALDAALGDAAIGFGAEAIFTGAGGDNVFALTRSAAPVADAIRSGHLALAPVVARDVAAIGSASIWDAWTHAGRSLLRRVRPPWPSDDRLLSPATDRSVPDHPWLDAPRAALLGRRGHVAALLRIQPFLDGYARFHRVPMIAPLLSQPIVELCLSIPSWEWVSGGVDRAVARQAFAGALPELVLFRRSKGRVESLFTAAYDRHRLEWRDLLLDGVLASAGLLDRAAIGRASAQPCRSGDPIYVRLTELVDIELWCRRSEQCRLESLTGAGAGVGAANPHYR